METEAEKRLFLITNATHYLNVKTYIETHSNGENFVILAIRPYKGFQKFQSQIETDPDLKLLKVIFIGKEWNNKFLEYVDIFSRIYKIKKLKRKVGEVEKVFFTNYNSWLHHYIVNKFSTAQPVLVSDGTAVLNVAEQRKVEKTIPFSGNQFFIEKVLNLKPIKHLHFYSQLKMTIADSDTIEVFKFTASQETVTNKNKLFFVGSPLVEAGYLSLERNIFNLKEIKAKFENKDIFYFAHRREKAENLDKYGFFGKVVKDSMPFEERMKQERELPLYVTSFVSSVLINLPQVLPQVLFYYYKLDENDISDEEYKTRYLELIKVFRNNNSANFLELN